MKTERKFARIYYDDLEREFPEVWNDPTLFWTWGRLLVVAEKMWPTVPELPRLVRPRAVSRLCELGIVQRVGPHGFAVRGLDAERTRRHEAARNAARNRWGNADALPDAMPRRDETSKDENPPNPPRGGGRRANGTNPRSIEAKEREAERRSAQANRLRSTQLRIHEAGGHFDPPNPECPRCQGVAVPA